MGFFTRNTMSLPERAELFTWLYFCHVDSHTKHSYWPEANDRTLFCNMWLEKTGHKASFMWLSKICAESENFAKFLVADTEQRTFLQSVVDVLSRYYKSEPLSMEDRRGIQSLHENAMSTLLASGLN